MLFCCLERPQTESKPSLVLVRRYPAFIRAISLSLPPHSRLWTRFLDPPPSPLEHPPRHYALPRPPQVQHHVVLARQEARTRQGTSSSPRTSPSPASANPFSRSLDRLLRLRHRASLSPSSFRCRFDVADSPAPSSQQERFRSVIHAYPSVIKTAEKMVRPICTRTWRVELMRARRSREQHCLESR